MVFLKPLESLDFSDIEGLKANKICESPILDYKEQFLDDSKLLKHVSAFANTQGGFLVFGVKETGKGGYPDKILGIDKNEINKERLEQVILGNIQPRLNVKIQLVEHKDPTKAVVVVEIPNSSLKPHMNGRNNKFYKRYNFEALPMTEIEVNGTYKRRFTSYNDLETYVSMMLKPKEIIIFPQIIGQIIVIPTAMNRIVNTANSSDFDWLTELKFKPRGFYLPSSRISPSPAGIKSQYEPNSTRFQKLEIHRNGAIHYFAYFGDKDESNQMVLISERFCLKLLQTLQFASRFYQKYNYFGNVKIMCNLNGLKKSYLLQNNRVTGYPYQLNELIISREFSTSIIDSQYEYIASGIMDEIFNCYGFWKCPLFDEEGNLIGRMPNFF